jgi:hypothetical protein
VELGDERKSGIALVKGFGDLKGHKLCHNPKIAQWEKKRARSASTIYIRDSRRFGCRQEVYLGIQRQTGSSEFKVNGVFRNDAQYEDIVRLYSGSEVSSVDAKIFVSPQVPERGLDVGEKV